MARRRPEVSIIIPTYNNPEFLVPCVQSIVNTEVLVNNDPAMELIIINNGEQPITYPHPAIKVLNPGRNLGWEGGLKLGLQHSKAPFVVFQNDDTFIPAACKYLYAYLHSELDADPQVGAIGPETTTAAGRQSIFNSLAPLELTQTTFLIFFTVMIRRSALEEVGGVDETLPGGDDIDLSIRLRQAGYKLLIHPEAFLIHHAFKTGPRLRGDETVRGGWNSREMTDETNRALIRKHGFQTFINTMFGRLGEK
jgi:GT2 family glycosyltransferase